MPVIDSATPNAPAKETKSDWCFNYRTRIAGTEDSDSDADNASSQPTDAKLLIELDLSAREEHVTFKPNPFSIAKINASYRPSAHASSVSCSRSQRAPEKLNNSGQTTILEGFKAQAMKAPTIVPKKKALRPLPVQPSKVAPIPSQGDTSAKKSSIHTLLDSALQQKDSNSILLENTLLAPDAVHLKYDSPASSLSASSTPLSFATKTSLNYSMSLCAPDFAHTSTKKYSPADYRPIPTEIRHVAEAASTSVFSLGALPPTQAGWVRDGNPCTGTSGSAFSSPGHPQYGSHYQRRSYPLSSPIRSAAPMAPRGHGSGFSTRRNALGNAGFPLITSGGFGNGNFISAIHTGTHLYSDDPSACLSGKRRSPATPPPLRIKDEDAVPSIEAPDHARALNLYDKSGNEFIGNSSSPI
ncbi:hypothetical protein B0H34DRAFT_486593 [Crassisporium funariophilum]|nr:hypothetical protein B0H34DRAFT_486593 [Crassisporium funariophilum]